MKKILKIIGVITCVTVLCLNLSINTKGNTENPDFPRLKLMQEANAECYSPFVAHAVCNIDMCFFSVEPDFECDPFKN